MLKVAIDNTSGLPIGTKDMPFMLGDTVIDTVTDTTETQISVMLFLHTLQKAWNSDGTTEVYLSMKPHYTPEEYEALRVKEAPT